MSKLNQLRSKKGQVTIFIVIGLILLAVFAGVWFLVSSYQTTPLEEEVEKSVLLTTIKPRIVSFVESCLEQTALPGIYLAGVQGGIIYLEEADAETILLTDNALIRYGYLNGVNLLSKERMEKDISRYLEENIGECLDGFHIFSKEGVLIEEKGDFQAETIVRLNEIIINGKYKLNIKQGDDSVRIDSFSQTIPLGVGKMLQEAQGLIQEQIQHPGQLRLAPPAEGYSLSTFPFDRTTVIYSLADERTINDVPFTFLFAVSNAGANTAPRLNYIPDQVLKQGQLFQYELGAEDDEQDALTFFSDAALFPVSSGGRLEVTPVQPGLYYVTVGVQDNNGLQDTQSVRIVMES